MFDIEYFKLIMNYNKLSIGCTLGISSLILLLGIIFVVMHHTILSNQIHLKLNENCPIIKIIDDI